MKTVDIVLRTSADPDSAFASILHAEKFTTVSPDIIVVTTLLDEMANRTWVIRFRDHVFSWTENVVPAPSVRRIECRSVGGDFRSLSASWSVDPADSGALMRVAIAIDLGVPIFDRIVEPLFARVLADAIRQALAELLPDVQAVVSEPHRDPEYVVDAYLASAAGVVE